ncbi:MAG: hypothetical protein IJ371_04490 [Clostridia bacterium]|nr:hypothetical protein [Clostridia bacterium]
MEKNEQPKLAESEEVINASDKVKDIKPKAQNQKPLTPYQKYKNSRNQNGKKYFDFYDDIKVYTHNIYDW